MNLLCTNIVFLLLKYGFCESTSVSPRVAISDLGMKQKERKVSLQALINTSEPRPEELLTFPADLLLWDVVSASPSLPSA